MRVPLSWLSEFVDIEGLTATEIAETLSLRSVEATVDRFGKEVENVVFAKVIEVKEHPERKKLNVVKVSAGKHGTFTVVTADKDVKEGDITVLALPGAKVGDVEIGKKAFGSVVSEGMLLSFEDLEIEEKSEGVIRLREDIEEGKDVKEVLKLGEEIIELDITPNRGDLLSVRGLAREISALFKVEKKKRDIPVFEDFGNFDIRIEDRDCRRYRGVIIEGIETKESPLWLKIRLLQCGQRPINNIVDITNYVMFQEGQPLHAFDLDTLEGGIVVRSAREGERIRTLDGEERKLSENILVIADYKKPVAVAGVIGGLETGVNEKTKNILLESAYFNPSRVRKCAKLLGVQTESSYRFERNVDIEHVDKAQNVAVDMILKLAGGKITVVKDVYTDRYEPKKVFVPLGKYMRYAGENYENEEVKEILERLEIPCEIKRCGIEVSVPSHRAFDISRDADIIEEIMRVKGYDSFKEEVISLPSTGIDEEDTEDLIRDFLSSNGLSEVINISFEDKELYEVLGMKPSDLEIVNPLVPSQRFMRSSLIPSLLRTALFNDKHHNYDVAIFEIGKVYSKEDERTKLGILVKGVKTEYPYKEWREEDVVELLTALFERLKVKFFLDFSEIPFLHPHVQSEIFINGKRAGFIGRLHPSIKEKLEIRGEPIIAEIDIEEVLSEGKRVIYNEVSKYPPIVRDIAFVIDKSLSVSKLLNEIESHIGDMMEDLRVFDIYTGEKVGEGKKSVGVRIVFRSKEKSLTDDEVNRIVDGLINYLGERLGAKIR